MYAFTAQKIGLALAPRKRWGVVRAHFNGERHVVCFSNTPCRRLGATRSCNRERQPVGVLSGRGAKERSFSFGCRMRFTYVWCLGAAHAAHNWHEGYCAKTITSNACTDDEEMGAFELKGREYSNWADALTQCSHTCLACKQCHYVSVSLDFRDCSWYRHCALPSLLTDIGNFRTLQVRHGNPHAKERFGQSEEELTALWAQLRALPPPRGCWRAGCSSKSAGDDDLLVINMALAAQTYAVIAEEDNSYSHSFRAIMAVFLCAVVSRFTGASALPINSTAIIPAYSKKFASRPSKTTATFVELEALLSGEGSRLSLNRHRALPGCRPEWELEKGECCSNATEQAKLAAVVVPGRKNSVRFRDMNPWPKVGVGSERQIASAFRSVVWANLGVLSPPTSEVVLFIKSAGGSTNGRGIVQEHAVAAALSKVFAARRPHWTFKHTNLEMMSYQSEIRLIRRSKFFISLFGGAMNNCRFLPPDSVVLEIQGAMKGELGYARIALSLPVTSPSTPPSTSRVATPTAAPQPTRIPCVPLPAAQVEAIPRCLRGARPQRICSVHDTWRGHRKRQ